MVLEVESLTKRYGEKSAVDGLTFRVEPGRIVRFLGPNGAGKSTTLRILLPLAAGSAVLGLALGAIVRSQAGAIAVALVWTALVDGLLAAAVDADAPYSLDGASGALTSLPESSAGGVDLLAPWAGGLVLVAYVAVLLAAGATVLSRRDVE